MTVSITLEACARTIRSQSIVGPVNLHIPSGQTMVLLGPSGCGKTSLLRLIAGLDAPAPGSRILFDRRDVTGLPIERRNVGMVFQNYALFGHMNVAQNVAYGLKVRKTPLEERRRRTQDLLDMMHLGPLADRPVTALSGGQKQRVALARAIAPQPDVLLLDEPLSALDAGLRDTLRTEINATLRQLGTTAIYVSHDQDEAMVLGDRIAVLNGGQIEQVGTPEQLWSKPANPFVATFFGGGTLIPAQRTGETLNIDGVTLPWHADDTTRDDATQDAVFLLLRPHSASLVPTGTPGSLPVTVEAVHFLGSRLRVDVRCGQNLLSLDMPPDTPAAHGPAALTILPNRSVLLPRFHRK